MGIRRVVPNIESDDLAASRDFYVGLLGFEVGMDMGWIVSFVSPTNPTAQVQVMRRVAPATLEPDMTVEVSDVDVMFAEAERQGAEVVYPVTDEPWGVRRFFVRDPNGVVVNVMSHRQPPIEI
jgi:catechol 2,3-dioxygenase-like lactoylglutathione lyase family enzyme